MDDGINDDYDDYDISFSNPMGEVFYSLGSQDNSIILGQGDDVPRVGENLIHIASVDGLWHQAERTFYALPVQPTLVEIPLISKLKNGELALVLEWQQGTSVNGQDIRQHNLDLHVEFKPSEDVLCTVDTATRQCNGAKLTADSQITNGVLTSIQAVKLSKVGNFDYLIWASQNKFNLTTINETRKKTLFGSLKVYAPHHSEPIFSVNLPLFTNEDQKWAGICFKGNNFTVSDPNPLTNNRPSVLTDCSPIIL